VSISTFLDTQEFFQEAKMKDVWELNRDESYGLLRRPIRINTPLIRHTRIIRKRIFAILGGTLGLHQTTLQPPRIVPPASRTL